jgi:hypothetical protein
MQTQSFLAFLFCEETDIPNNYLETFQDRFIKVISRNYFTLCKTYEYRLSYSTIASFLGFEKSQKIFILSVSLLSLEKNY